MGARGRTRLAVRRLGRRRRPRLPNLIVIGAAKCGTTSLHEYLDTHPAVQMSRPKELNFFVAERNWPKGVDWYMRHFDAPGATIYGESSPQYSVHPYLTGVPERISSLIPDARIIYLVRDPIERAISAWMARSYWSAKESRPMEVALREPDSIYLMRGRYGEQLSLYLEHFSAEQILVIDNDEFRDDRARVLSEVHRFLGIDAAHRSVHHHRRYNTGRYHALAPVPGPRRLRRHLGRARAITAPLPRPEPSNGLREWLIDQFSEDVRRFRELTGRPFAHWSL